MPAYNQLTVIGNLGRDPEMRYLQDGTEVTSFSVAVGNPYRKDDPPLWVKVTCWRKQAEAAATYLSKGDCVMAVGRLSLDEWEGRDGERRSQCALDAQSVVFLPRSSDGDSGWSAAGGGRDDEPRQHGRDDADLPFGE